MTQIGPLFSISEFENYGTTNLYLSSDQQSLVTQTENRVNSQLNWLAQLLGWSGDDYWNRLPSSVSQKRQLQAGSFGFYNGYIYPEIIEIRNWDNSIVMKADSRILSSLTFYLGDYSYQAIDLKQSGENYVVSFEELSDQFYLDISANEQLKIISAESQPSPFVRPNPETSGDASFICEQQGVNLVLYPSYNTEKTLPYLYNVFIVGSRYFFDKPVSLLISSTITVLPEYDFLSETWYLQIPANSNVSGVGLSGTLSYEGSLLDVFLMPWVDPSDWGTKNNIDNFHGVWGNKGGELPFSFVFDALSIHGFDEKKSVLLKEITRTVAFDELLNFVYYQKAPIETQAPPAENLGQVWWNSQSGDFSVYWGDPLNCGPWVEVNYPFAPTDQPSIDYIFQDIPSLVSYPEPIPVGCLVRVLDITGLGPSEGVIGLSQTMPGPGQVDIYKSEDSPYWNIFRFIYDNEADFAVNAESNPSRVPVNLLDSANLDPDSISYSISNLQFTITGGYTLSLMKETNSDTWFIAPPSRLKYIGNTRLYSSSLNYGHPVEGEMNWDFMESDPNMRASRIFYYSRWVQDPLTDEWYLEGDWVNIDGSHSSSTVPETVNFEVIKVYCNQELLTAGESYITENYQFSYYIDSGTGNFVFSYLPMTFLGSVKFPEVTISDSLTSAFVHDVSNLVFSGLIYYMSPNVRDSETLLRIWKSKNLHVIDSLSDLEILRNANPLRADINSGPGDENWERYFVRLPPAYGRNEAVWQKVNLICQDFGYWGSSISPEHMECPPEKAEPRIYEAVHLYDERTDSPIYLYSEPYLYSDVVFGYGYSYDFDNSVVLPSYDQPYDDFSEAEIISYQPLHNRQADVTSPIGRGYGEWEGGYYRAEPCSKASGFLVNDLVSGTLEPIKPPVWDSSIYKLPPTCLINKVSSTVDANHYKVGYAFFAADLSAAEDGFFDLG